MAVTSSLDCQWYSVSDAETVSAENTQQEGRVSVQVKLLAELKKADLCTKLRKLDFREYDSDMYTDIKLNRNN